ncbi:MAG: DUF4365 domain-containing protein [Clostridia bacterium]|nr:DUF4365 domain-containing protein [Clostridia bacterium]
MIFPRDCSARAIGSKARAIFPNKLNLNHWEFHDLTGTDHGTDMIIEYIEDEEFKNNKIECQIKGTMNLKKMIKKDHISFSLDVKTINYALNCKYAFILFVVDVNCEDVYYIAIQDYFIANPDCFEKLKNNTNSMSIFFSAKDKLDEENDYELIQCAKSVYIRKKEDEIIKM